MNQPVIQTINATKCFNTQMVFVRRNFEVPRGSVVGLLGNNGSGKTTLLKTLLGLLRVDSGEAKIFGEDS